MFCKRVLLAVVFLAVSRVGAASRRLLDTTATAEARQANVMLASRDDSLASGINTGSASTVAAEGGGASTLFSQFNAARVTGASNAAVATNLAEVVTERATNVVAQKNGMVVSGRGNVAASTNVAAVSAVAKGASVAETASSQIGSAAVRGADNEVDAFNGLRVSTATESGEGVRTRTMQLTAADVSGLGNDVALASSIAVSNREV